MIGLDLGTLTRWGLNFIALLGMIVLLRLGRDFFIPPVIALLLAAVLWPAVRWLNRTLRMPWSLACLTSVFCLVLLNLVVSVGFLLAMTRMLQGGPDLRTDTGQKELYSLIRDRVQKISPQVINDEYWPKEASESKVFQWFQQALQSPYLPPELWRLVSYANEWVWHWVLVMFILVFLLLEGRMLTRRAEEVVGPGKEIQAKAAEAFKDMSRQVRGYLLWRTIINAGIGIVVGMFYQGIGLKEPWTWALLTAVLCYVPYIGPLVAGLPPLIDCLISKPDEPWYILVILVFYMGIMLMEGYVVVPVVMGRSMEMNATTVMLACLFWELVWGLPGLFLAMPLMAAIKAICWHIPDLRPIANLMSTRVDDLSPLDETPAPAARKEKDAAKVTESVRVEAHVTEATSVASK